MTLSTWADDRAYLSPESSHESGKWTCLPYQREIMDCVTDPKVKKITWMKSARVGYTKILNNIIGYHIDHDPKSILAVQPTVKPDAEGYSKEEIAPMIRDTPCLRDKVADVKSKSSNNTILKKKYPGGFLTLVGANSPGGFRRLSVPIVLFDEVDGYPQTAGAEGDQIRLGTRRTAWFWDSLIVIGSTPTIKDVSRVEASFLLSDQRYYNVPCPICKKEQVLKFGTKETDFGIKWPEDHPEDAYYLCEHCHEKIKHSKKRWMVKNGIWQAKKPFVDHAGFHLWAAYSFAPNAAWSNLAIEFLEVKDKPEELKTFVNTVMGETWEDRGSRPAWKVLSVRAEPYKITTVPSGGLLVTSGTDVHDNRLDIVVRAWGKGEENFLLYWTQIYGDVTKKEVWDQHDNILNMEFQHESKVGLRIMSAAVDAGDNTHIVYNYCRKRSPIVMATYGSQKHNQPILGRPSKKDVDYMGTIIKKGVQIWPIGTDTAKSIIYQRFNLTEPGPGFYHFPLGIDPEYYQQITAEKLVTTYNKKGFPVKVWQNVRGNRQNHALDAEVYCYAAAIRAGIATMQWDALELNYAAKGRGQAPPVAMEKQRKVRSRGIG